MKAVNFLMMISKEVGDVPSALRPECGGGERCEDEKGRARGRVAGYERE